MISDFVNQNVATIPLIVVNAFRTNNLENVITFGNHNDAIHYDINSFTITVKTSSINFHYQDKDGTSSSLQLPALFSALASEIESVSIPPTPLSNRLSPWYILLMLAVILLLIAMIVLAISAYKRNHLVDEDSGVL